MNNLYVALIVLGIFQGVAEFLPISSSGHLVILEQVPFIKDILHYHQADNNLFINVALHLATLFAVIFFLRRDIAEIITGSIKGLFSRDFTRKELKIALYIITATIPAFTIGLLFIDFFEFVYTKHQLAYALLIINGFILIYTKKIPLKDRQLDEIGFIRSLLIGLCQAFAIFPGISRSGMTIAGGLMNGLKPVDSARFSFLMAVPIIAGAALFESLKATADFSQRMVLPLILAMVISFFVALGSMKLLFALVTKIRIDIFGYYTIALGTAGLIIFYLM